MSAEPLSFEFVLELHDQQIEAFGGESGLLNLGALESALEQPCGEYFGVVRYDTVWLQAAAYFFYIAHAHAFVDGNKRTATHCCLTWLTMHSLNVDLDDRTLEDVVVEAVAEHWSVETFATRIQESSLGQAQPLSTPKQSDEEFWIETDLVASMSLDAAEVPRNVKMATDLRRTLVLFGIYGMDFKRVNAVLEVDGNGRVNVFGINFLTTNRKQTEIFCIALGLDPKKARTFNEDKTSDIDAFMDVIRKLMIRNGISSISGRGKRAYLGWRNVGTLRFQFHELHISWMNIPQHRRLLAIYGPFED